MYGKVFNRVFYHLSGSEISTGFHGNMADKGVDKGADKGVELSYVGIDAILEQMRRKAMKQSGLTKYIPSTEKTMALLSKFGHIVLIHVKMECMMRITTVA